MGEGSFEVYQSGGRGWGRTLMMTARLFGMGAHAACGKLYNGGPYVIHYDNVVRILKKFGVTDPIILAAASIHDVLEDTEVPESILVDIFGEPVVRLVRAVTSEPREASRKVRNLHTYPKIRQIKDAVQLKLGDRIANVEFGVREQNRHTEMYRKEQPGFRAALYREGEFEEMWAYLELLLKE